MIRILLLSFCLLGLASGEEATLADLVPGLSSDVFKERQEAMEKVQAFAKENPENFLQEIPALLKETKDPEARLRLREVALGLKFKTTKSLFGFKFIMSRGANYKGKIVAGVLLMEVVDDHPAKRDGLKARDLILAVDGKTFPRTLPEEEVREIFASQTPGEKVALTVQREREIINIDVSPMEVDVDQDIKERLRLDFDDWLREKLEQ